MSSSSTRYDVTRARRLVARGPRAHRDLLGAAICSAICSAVVGCGPKDGDAWVYRVAVGAMTEDAGCYYPDTVPPPDVKDDRDTLFSSQTWVLFVTADDKMLDIGSMALVEKEDESWVFETIATDVEFVGVDQSEAVLTLTTHNTVDLERSGKAVQGTVSERVITRCNFLTATPSGDVCPASPPDCVRSAAFSGVRLNDVQLTEGVDKTPPGPPMPPPP